MQKYSTMDEQKFLLKKRCIVASGEINSKLSDYIRMHITEMYDKNQNDPINMLIDSPGGSITTGGIIYDFCQSFPGTLKNYVNGFCKSSAFYLLLGAKLENRFATRHSEFLLHNGFLRPNISLSENFDEQIAQLRKDEKNLKEDWRELFEKETLLKGESLENFLNNSDRYRLTLTSKEVKELGFISHILTPGEKLPCF